MSNLLNRYRTNIRKIHEKFNEDEEGLAKALEANENAYERACDRAFEQARDRNLSQGKS
jgi:hypothetical protein